MKGKTFICAVALGVATYGGACYQRVRDWGKGLRLREGYDTAPPTPIFHVYESLLREAEFWVERERLQGKDRPATP